MVQIDVVFLRSVNGLLQKCVTAIIVIICISSSDWSLSGHGFIIFTAASALLNTLIVLTFFLLKLPENHPGLAWFSWFLVRAVCNSFWTVCYFISFCIATAAARKGATLRDIGNMESCYGLAAFFCIIGLGLHAYYAVVFYRKYKETSNQTAPSPGGVTGSTVSGSNEPPPPYSANGEEVKKY